VAVVNDTVALTSVFLRLLDSTMEAPVSAALDMGGKATDPMLSTGTVVVPVFGNVKMVTPVVEAAAEATFTSPSNLHTTAVPEAMVGVGSLMVSTRLLPPGNEDVPAPRPVQATALPANDANVAPATVTILIVPDVAVVNDTVAVTDGSFLTDFDSTKEAAVSAALDMGGKTTAETMSIPALLAA